MYKELLASLEEEKEIRVEPQNVIDVTWCNTAHNLFWKDHCFANLYKIGDEILVDSDWAWEVGHGYEKPLAILAQLMREIGHMTIYCGDTSHLLIMPEDTERMVEAQIFDRRYDELTVEQLLVNEIANRRTK